MKKIMNKINFAIIGLLVSIPSFAAPTETINVTSDMCELVKRLHNVFNILRIAAFIGAAFYIAGWAWGWIAGGEAKVDEIKKRGIALIVGFGLLFMIGVVLSFILSASGAKMMGCPELTKW